jgi:hypothetical protein
MNIIFDIMMIVAKIINSSFRFKFFSQIIIPEIINDIMKPAISEIIAVIIKVGIIWCG